MDLWMYDVDGLKIRITSRHVAVAGGANRLSLSPFTAIPQGPGLSTLDLWEQ